jgi:hypothetical protein
MTSRFTSARYKGLAALLILVAVIPVAVGQDPWYRFFGMDGNRLIVNCKAAVRSLNSSHKPTTATGTVQEAYDMGYCQGLVSGVASSMNSNDGVDLVTPNPSTAQLVRVVE